MNRFTDVHSEIAASSEVPFSFEKDVTEWFSKNRITISVDDIVKEVRDYFDKQDGRYITLGVFGSVLTDRWNPSTSDIDLSLLVDLNESMDAYIFCREFESEFFDKYGYKLHLTFLDITYHGRETSPAVYAEPIDIMDSKRYVDYLDYFGYIRILENDRRKYGYGSKLW